MSGGYAYVKCDFCDQRHSVNGLASYSHKMKHVREGKLVRVAHWETHEERFLTIDQFKKWSDRYYIPHWLEKDHTAEALAISNEHLRHDSWMDNYTDCDIPI